VSQVVDALSSTSAITTINNLNTSFAVGAGGFAANYVGRIDPELFETDTSGYTQFGRAYLSLQSAVPDQQFKFTGRIDKVTIELK
jgi:hypothetical protein